MGRGLAAGVEETLHELSGFGFEKPPIKTYPSGKELRSMESITKLRLTRSINNTLYPRPKECTCTHRTGLYRHVERTALEVLPPKGFGGRGDG